MYSGRCETNTEPFAKKCSTLGGIFKEGVFWNCAWEEPEWENVNIPKNSLQDLRLKMMWSE